MSCQNATIPTLTGLKCRNKLSRDEHGFLPISQYFPRGIFGCKNPGIILQNYPENLIINIMDIANLFRACRIGDLQSVK